MRSQRWRVVAAAVAVVVVVASLVPAEAGATGGLPPGVDKLLHLVGYAALSFSDSAALRAQTVHKLGAIVVGVALLGAGVELVQPTVGRTASLLDAAANLAGAMAGVSVYWLVIAQTTDTLAVAGRP